MNKIVKTKRIFSYVITSGSFFSYCARQGLLLQMMDGLYYRQSLLKKYKQAVNKT